MRLSFWMKVGLGAVAAIAVALTVLSASAPTASACAGADDSRDAGLLVQAAKAYTKVLSDDPKSACAVEGMRALCDDAAALRGDGLAGEANATYKAMLTHEPRRADGTSRCAEDGVRATTPSSPPAPASSIRVVVTERDGRDGRDGRDAPVSRVTVMCRDPKQCEVVG
jgi:hypothetical protein